MRVSLAALMMLAHFSGALAQPSPKAQGTATAPKKEEPKPACEKFSVAQNAVYAAYVRLIANDLPDPAKVQDRSQLGRELEALYNKQMEIAKGGDMAALRKGIALEIFGMQLRKEPPIDATQRKLCLLGKEKGREALLETLACAVTSLDGPRREQPGNKDTARQMMEKAKASIPADANATDTGKLLLDDVTRGLAGCY